MSPVSKLTLTDVQRKNMKEPLGELVTGTPDECNDALRQTITQEKPRLVVSVGDTVSRHAVQSNIRPDIVIVDNSEKRAEAVQFTHSGRHIFRTINLPGTIEKDAWKTVERAVNESNSLVIVDGEEDLLTLVAVLAAPAGSVVVYGQPGQGIVIVRVTSGKKAEVRQILEGMDRSE